MENYSHVSEDGVQGLRRELRRERSAEQRSAEQRSAEQRSVKRWHSWLEALPSHPV